MNSWGDLIILALTLWLVSINVGFISFFFEEWCWMWVILLVCSMNQVDRVGKFWCFLPETLIRGISPKLIKTLDIKSMERVGMFSMAWAWVPLKYWIGVRHVVMARIVRGERSVGSFHRYLSSRSLYSRNNSYQIARQGLSSVSLARKW